jgi:ATP-dependent Clp protease protease subunit
MSKKFWNFKNVKEDPKIGELDIYGEIADSSWWGDEVTPKQFKKDMDALGDISELNVYINSPGGDVFAGQTIYSILKRKKCAVNVYIDGLAASAASVIAMVGRADGNTLNMPKNAMLMIHNPWSIAWGYASDMRQMADTLDKIRDSIVAVYKDGSNLEEKDIIELMDAETWMTAQDALDYGFIDHIEEHSERAFTIRRTHEKKSQ